jgi:alpha-tubulin suppressor-like RCC1 family protein
VRGAIVWLVVAATGCQQLFGLETPTVASDAPTPTGIWHAAYAGHAHSCALRDNGELWCWGEDFFAEVGDGMMEPEVDFKVRVGNASWLAATAGMFVTCGVQSDSSLWCWGDNAFGRLGLPAATLHATTPTQIGGGTPWTTVSAGGTHTCAIDASGGLWCWGGNASGELGYATSMVTTDGVPYQSTPTPVDSASWLAVAAAGAFTCGIRADHSLWCWGANDSGQLGINTGTSAPVPAAVASTESWTQIVAGNTFACGVTVDQHLRCWGMIPSLLKELTPAPLAGLDTADWIDVAAGENQACARRADGTTWCWGDNSHGQRTGTDPIDTSPRLLPGGPWISISSGLSHTCAVDASHDLWCVGSDGFSQLGDGGTSSRTPVVVTGAWAQVTVRGFNTCMIDLAGKATCAGAFPVGDNTIAPRSVPTSITTDTWTAVAPSGCGASTTSLSCWGLNDAGEVGDGSTTPRLAPVPIESTTFTAVDVSAHACALDSNKHAWCWGTNTYGELGLGDTATHITPTEVSTATWDQISVGGYHTCALAGTTVHCWGLGSYGQLGLGETTPLTTPTALQGSFLSVSAGAYFTCAITVNHLLNCWGLGYSSMPGQIGTATWNQVAAGSTHACGIQTDGTLWCFGSNLRGALGDGTFVDRASPVQVGTDTHWTSVTAGADHTCARKSDNTTWCWGRNQDGELATGNAWRTDFVPVQ